MKVSISIEAMAGVNWPLWKRLVPMLESMGYATIYRSDHFSLGTPPTSDALELITSLTYLADHTQRADFGSLVAPVSIRDPVMLARQAMSINDLSGGRMILGVGAGWMEEEHTQFGYNLGDIKTRMDRLEEALEVITRLTRCDEPVSFQGRYFRLQEAQILPRPQQPTRILVGGNGPKRTLPMVARYADIWNCELGSLEKYQEASAQLDSLIRAAGRTPSQVKRSIFVPLLPYDTPDEINRSFNLMRTHRVFPDMNDEQGMGMFAAMNGIKGNPQEIVQKMQAYAQAGVEEFVIQWLSVYDLEGLQKIASEILPHFQDKFGITKENR